VRIAFYPHDKGDDVPDHEMSMSYTTHENGVATGISFDYGDFVVGAELTRIEPLPSARRRKKTRRKYNSVQNSAKTIELTLSRAASTVRA
jgi:hypothetical protein